jgi:hypothetical protein
MLIWISFIWRFFSGAFVAASRNPESFLLLLVTTFQHLTCLAVQHWIIFLNFAAVNGSTSET